MFDEATSALDVHTEMLVYYALEGIAQERSVVTIAHRLAPLTDVIDGVRLTQRATPGTLAFRSFPGGAQRMQVGEIKPQMTRQAVARKRGRVTPAAAPAGVGLDLKIAALVGAGAEARMLDPGAGVREAAGIAGWRVA